MVTTEGRWSATFEELGDDLGNIRNRRSIATSKLRQSTPRQNNFDKHQGKMPLHLLHHKSWHVYNKDNVERVQRDKEKARLKEEAEEQRMNEIDQERRLAQLRGNAYGIPVPEETATFTTKAPSKRGSDKRGSEDKGSEDGAVGRRAEVESQKHFNLFEDVEREAKKSGITKKEGEGNPEREKEVEREKKKWEDLVTSKLINSAKEHNPWYSTRDLRSGAEKQKSEVEKEVREQKEMKMKSEADPLKAMEKFLERKRVVEEREERRREKMERELTERERRRGRGRTPEFDGREHGKRRRDDDGVTDSGKERSRSPRGERHRSRKHRHRHHHRRDESPDLEALRKEREKREAIEREKVEKLMKTNDRVDDRYVSIGYHGYSAQYNPAAVRR